jgi:hypothetical protein
MLVRMGERVAQLRVLQAPCVMRRGQREKRRFASGELEQGGSHRGSMAHRTDDNLNRTAFVGAAAEHDPQV